MEAAAIRFRFSDAASARLAFDTLEELGYAPVYDGHQGTELHIHVEKEIWPRRLKLPKRTAARLWKREI